MLSADKIKRINELSKKSKTTGLSIEEAKEQTQLRKEYLRNIPFIHARHNRACQSDRSGRQ